MVSKKRSLDFKDISDKGIVVGVKVADDEKIGGEMVEVNGVKEVPCVVLEDEAVSDKKIDDEKSEVSGVKVASCAMVGDEVVDNEKTSEESGIKMVSSSASSEGVDSYFL